MKTLVLLALLVISQNPQPGSGSVTGQILRGDGSPADDVDVTAMQVEQYGNVNPATAILGSEGRTDAQGHYRLERVPPGRYFITAGLTNAPTYYPGVKTRQEARSIAVTANQVVPGVDFKLATSVGVRVRGRVSNLPTTFPRDFLDITLQPVNSSYSTSQPIPRDNRFEFSRVVPGQYEVCLRPATGSVHRCGTSGNAPAVHIEVANKDVDGVVIAAGMFALGRASVDNGGPLPPVEIGLTKGTPETLSAARIQEMRASNQVMGTRFFLPVYSASLPVDYTIGLNRLPLGYYVKSMTADNVDLLRSPLTVTGTPLPEISVILTKTPPPNAPPDVTVSGRVTRLENARRGNTIYLLLDSSPTVTNPTRMFGETTANRDGTFEFRNVLPGRYVVRAVTPQSSDLTIEITNRDITNLELPLIPPRYLPPPPAPPPAVPEAGLLFFSINGNPPLYEEGFLTFFRIDRAGTRVEEVRMDAVPFVTLQPGNYSLRSYSRPCSGNCGYLDAPRSECSATFSIARGQVLNAERVMQGETCTIRFR